MKKILFCMIALALVSGCASMADTPTYAPDYAKMSAIERAADRFGTKVVWVNMPQKKVAANTGS